MEVISEIHDNYPNIHHVNEALYKLINRKDWHKLTFKKNDVCFRSENIHFGDNLEDALFSYRYSYTQELQKEVKKKKPKPKEKKEGDEKKEGEESEEEEEKTEEENVWYYFSSTFKVLKDMSEYFVESNPNVLGIVPEVDKITGDDRLKQYVFGKVLGEGANAIVYACKDEKNEKGALKQLFEENFQKISFLYREAAYSLLFDDNSPLLSLKDMFLQSIEGEIPCYILNLIMDEAEGDLHKMIED